MRKKLAIAVAIVVVAGLGYWFRQTRAKTAAGGSSTLATISDSGSTNTRGWDLVINQDGSGQLTCKPGPSFQHCTGRTFARGTFPGALNRDLSTTNLSGYQDTCVMSVSFGTVDTLTYNGVSTRGVNCYAETATTGLAKDLTQVLAKVSN